MKIKLITSSAEIRCLNCVWFSVIDDGKNPPTEGTCYLNYPETNTYAKIWDRCPKGTFIVKHRYYGYSYRTTPQILVMEKEENLIKDSDPIESYPCISDNEPTGWCDK